MREYQTPIYPNNNNFDANFHIGCSFYIQSRTRKDKISKQKAKQDTVMSTTKKLAHKNLKENNKSSTIDLLL